MSAGRNIIKVGDRIHTGYGCATVIGIGPAGVTVRVDGWRPSVRHFLPWATVNARGEPGE